MTRISASDQILALLRARLEHMAALKKRRKAGPVGETDPGEASNLQRIRALARIDDLSDEDFNRSLLQGLLIQQFGEAMANDPRFQDMVTRITEILDGDTEGRLILAAARRELAG